MLQIKKYEYQEKYYVEEITDEEEENMMDYWLCKKGYGIKIHMYGINYRVYNEEERKEMLDNNINNYIEIHKNHYH